MKIVNNPTAEIVAKTQGVGKYANYDLDELIVGLARQSSDKSTIEPMKKNCIN